MFVDLHVAGRKVLVIGGGNVGERKAIKFLQENSNVTIVSRNFTKGLRQLGQESKVKLIRVNIDEDPSPLDSLMSSTDVVVTATNDRKLNREATAQARRTGTLVSNIDDPSNSDFSMSSTTNIEGVQIAISTGGRSPAMAKIIRERIEKMIKQEDVLQIKLQEYARNLVKSEIPDGIQRRKTLYRIIHDKRVKSLLREGLFEESKILAEKIAKCN